MRTKPNTITSATITTLCVQRRGLAGLTLDVGASLCSGVRPQNEHAEFATSSIPQYEQMAITSPEFIRDTNHNQILS